MTEAAIYTSGVFICGGFFLFATDRKDMRFAACCLAAVWPASLLVLFGAIVARFVVARGAAK